MLIVAILVPTPLLVVVVFVHPFVQIAQKGAIMVSIVIMPVPALVFFWYFVRCPVNVVFEIHSPSACLDWFLGFHCVLGRYQ